MFYLTNCRFALIRPAMGVTGFTLSSLALAAGGHFAVDDASLTEAGRCQLESWISYANNDDRSATIAPACNLGGNLELAAAFSRSQADGSYASDIELSAKTVLHEAATFAVALSLSSGWQQGEDRLDGADLVLPVSLMLNERFTTHLNVGWGWQRDQRDLALWGIGADLSLRESLHLIGESYGSDQGGTRAAVGLRYGLTLAGRELDLDLGWDRSRHDASDRITSAGINIAF